MRKIQIGGKLGQGNFLLVDNENARIFSYFNWCLHTKGYAMAHIPKSGDSTTTGQKILAHHLVLIPPKGMEIDHRNGNKLDCQRQNLRLATKSNNLSNRSKQKNNTSGYVGVCWVESRKKWMSYIKLNHKPNFIGYFPTAISAAMARDIWAKELHGKFARLNFLYEN